MCREEERRKLRSTKVKRKVPSSGVVAKKGDTLVMRGPKGVVATGMVVDILGGVFKFRSKFYGAEKDEWFLFDEDMAVIPQGTETPLPAFIRKKKAIITSGKRSKHAE